MPIGNWVRGAQCRIIGELHGQDTVNVLHFASDEAVFDPGVLDEALVALAQALRDCVVEFLLPAVTQDWRFIRTEAIGIFPARTDPVISTGVPENVGQLGVTSVSFAASLVNVRTGGGGRSGRGKMFLPPAGEAQIAQSTIDGPTLVLLAAFTACVGAKFMGGAPESDWHYGVLSQKTMAGVLGNFNNAFRPAVSLNLAADVAKLSSRKRGNGA